MPILEIRTPDGKTSIIDLIHPSYTFGREPGCDISFPQDGGLSRQHFVVERQADGWGVRDLGSRNGTFVNSRRITEACPLAPGDMIKGSKLVVSYKEEPPPPKTAVIFEKESLGDFDQRATVVVNLKDLLSTSGQLVPTGVPARPKQWTSPVQALLRAGRELVSGRPLPELFKVILDMAIEASGAERGVLMTIEDSGLVEQARSEGEFRISSWVRDKVLDQRESLLIHDVRGDAALQNRQSIMLENVLTLMAVPLQTEDRVIGLIYVDSRSLVRPFVADDLNLLTVMANVAAIRIERQRLAAVEAAEEHYRIELEQAASIQRLCLPEKSPSIRGYQLEGTSVPCFSVGGDYFDYFQLPDGRWMVVIGDVAGKGTPAALLVMSTQAHANALARTITDLGDFVTQLNLAILPRCPGDRFISLFACIVDPGSEEVVFCNAGHNPPVLLRADGSTQQLRAGGPVLGIVPVPKYPTSKVTLAPGDQLVLYTDGITEAHSPEDKEFETGNLEKFLREKSTLEPKELLGAILKRVEEWTHGAPPSDDRTLVMVRRS